MKTLITFLILALAPFTVQAKYKEKLVSDAKRCYENPENPKEFCDCVVKAIDKTFTEEDMQEIIEGGNQAKDWTAGMTINHIVQDCAQKYQQAHPETRQ